MFLSREIVALCVDISYYICMTKINKMTKQQLIENIKKADSKLNNAKWIKHTPRHWVGVMFVHRRKLIEELKSR